MPVHDATHTSYSLARKLTIDQAEVLFCIAEKLSYGYNARQN